MKNNQIAFVESMANVQMKEDVYRSNFELNIKMAGLKASDTFCAESQRAGELLSNMVKYKPLLIYRFTGSNCSTCYIELLTELQNELADSFGFDKLRALSSQLTERDLLILKRTYSIKFPIYLIQPKSFDWIVEDYNSPYFFVLHPDMTISHIYMPDKDFPELNKQYLESVKRFLSD